MQPPRAVPIVLVALLVVSGCGDRPSAGNEVGAAAPATSPASPAVPGPAAALSEVPELDQADATTDLEVFHFLAEDGSVLGRAPWSACLAHGCWDGAPHLAGPVPSAGSPDALWFAFAYPGWDFEHVSFNPVGDPCGARVIEVQAQKVGDRLFRIDPAGLAGEWRVDVFGYGRDGGDAVASVRWTTEVDGTMPAPSATGALFYDADGERVTYGGPTLGVGDLAATPRTASGTWMVTDASGTSVTVPLTREQRGCDRAGAVSLAGPELTDDQVRSLAGKVLTYTVELRLDRRTYVGTAVWTQRPSQEDEPELRFSFDPPLPAYTG